MQLNSRAIFVYVVLRGVCVCQINVFCQLGPAHFTSQNVLDEHILRRLSAEHRSM